MSVVCASEFGGPNDPSTGHTGYRGDDLRGKMAFAELNMGTALGGLPHGARLTITYGGRSVVAEKLDIGLGGSGCGGHMRAIDLWWETARALGFSGLGTVNVSGAGTAATTKLTGGKAQNVVGGIPFTPSIPNPGELLPVNPAEGVKSLFDLLTKTPGYLDKFKKVIELLTTKEGWLRIGKVLIGLALIFIGLLGMANIQTGKVAAKGTRAAAKGAEVAALIPK